MQLARVCGVEFAGVDFMKSRNFPGLLLTIAAVTVTCLFTKDVMAQNGSSDVATIQNVAPTAAPAGGAPVQLSYGVSQIIQLSQAKVSDDTIVNYIRNSGSSYGMDASQIIYLKQQGVSGTVINTMLNQPRQATRPHRNRLIPPPAARQRQPWSRSPRRLMSRPFPPRRSMSFPTRRRISITNNYYHPSCGYYPYYGGWYYPAVSFSVGFGGGYRGGYYHGGWGGGYHGGYHGGGGWHH